MMSSVGLLIKKSGKLRQNYRAFSSQNWAEIDISKCMNEGSLRGCGRTSSIIEQPCSNHGGPDAER